MRKHARRFIIAGGMLLVTLFPLVGHASAADVTAIPKLDVSQFMGTWYEIARFPVKREKHCVSDGMTLYALGDKKNTIQVVTSCQINDGNSDSWNAKGKIDKAGDGRVKLTYIFPVTTKAWVLATGPAYEWALIGSPNHKLLVILSKATSLAPDVLTDIKAKAIAQGFDTSKLISITQYKQGSPAQTSAAQTAKHK